jgi:tetratricopeptide (TPR) repeat protein
LKNTIFTKTFATLIVVFGLALVASAQTVNKDVCRDWKNMERAMLSAGYYVYDGCESYAAQNFEAAARRFEAGVERFPDHAALAYHLGSAYAAYAAMNTDAGTRASLIRKARAAFEKAVNLDPSLKNNVDAVMAQDSDKETKPDESGGEEAGMKVPRIGDTVEVKTINGGKWVRGKVTKIVSGLPCPGITVVHDAYGDGKPLTLNFFCGDFRPVTNKSSGDKDSKRAETAGGAFAYGNYACKQGATGRTPIGYIRMNADGTYRYLDGGSTGRYKYNAKTGEITWLSGYFTQGYPTTTTYKPGNRASGINITFHTNSGKLYWFCNHNK